MNKIFRKVHLLLFLLILLYNCNINKEKSQVEQNLPIWIKMIEKPSVNMAEVRKSFDDYWKDKEHYKGDRSKQFEQWYAINSKRLDAYGNVISAELVRNEFQKIRLKSAIKKEGNWFNYGPINVGPRKNGAIKDGGRVKQISFHPTDAKTYLVSTFKSGLFKTTDKGISWTPLTDHLTEEVYISKYVPSNHNIIFIGTNLGILKSTDGGATWNSTGLTSGKTNGLLLKKDNENVILAGNDNGIYRSTDAGVNFTQVLIESKVEEIKQHPTNPSIMYASTNGATSAFYKSTDGGINWVKNSTDFGKGAFMKIAVTPAAPNNVYVINSRDHLGDDSFDGVYVSTNAATSFTKKSGTSPCITGYKSDGRVSRGQPNYNLFIVVDPNNPNIVYAGGVKSWKSTDGGITWSTFFDKITPEGYDLHLDQLSWAYSPLNDRLFAVNDGGIYYLDENNKFNMITDGLPIAEVWECTQSQQNKANVAGGTFHCGIKLNKNGKWYSPWGGDEATVLFDYSDDTYAYHFKYGKISRSKDGGMSFQRINSLNADRGAYTGTGVLDKSDVNTLFVGLFEVERINNARTATSGQVWDKISSFGGTTKIEKIEQSDANHNILYVSRQNGKFYRSDNIRDTAPTFSELTLPVAGTVVDIATHPTNENFVYILLGSKIFKSINKGASWVDISSGLPQVALLEMIYDKSSEEGIYVGTDLGVYYKDNSLSSWIDYSKGLPAIRVSGMDIYYGKTRNESILTVSTDGRGFWRSVLNNVTATKPLTNFTSDQTTVLKGKTISYSDSSTENPLTWSWTFEGGRPATSELKNPTVTYNQLGTYKTTLKTMNTAGSDVKEIVNYVTVIESNGPENLQFQYNFSNNLNDISSYARNLKNVGNFTPVYTTDKDNKADKAFEAPNSSTKYLSNRYTGIGLTNERTVTAWIKTSTSNSRKTIISWGTNASGKMFNIMVENGNVRIEGGDCNVQNDDSNVTRLDNDTWRHIAVTYNAADGDKMSDIKIYIDGIYYANQPDSGDSYNSEGTVLDTDNETNGILIGAANYNTNYYWRGDLDDVRLYSKALSASEIVDVMNASALSLNSIKKNKNKYVAYPNPVDTLLTINSEDFFSKSLNFKTFDMNGSSIKLKHYRLSHSKIQIDMSDLSSGIYFVNLNDDKNKPTFKVIKK
ncbi:LamG-like jellyroll fold domain-containing protein [Bacteroidota bacterium]